MPTAEEQAQGLAPEQKKRQKLLDRSKQAVEVLDRASAGVAYAGVELTRISFKLPGDTMSEGLVIFNGIDKEGGPVVAFHSAVGFEQLFVGGVVRFMNGKLKWRVDEFNNG